MRKNGKTLREIGESLGLKKKTIGVWFNDLKLDTFNIHRYDLQTFYNEDDISYYLLGAFMTDGCIHTVKNYNYKSVSISSNDKDWLELMNKYICKNKPIREHNRRGCYISIYNTTELADWLISKGCTPRKSLTLKFPEVPKKYSPDFIRGCWDGDGSVGIYRRWRKDRECLEVGKQCAMFTGSKDFATSIQMALLSLGIQSSAKGRVRGHRRIENRIITSTNEQYEVRVNYKDTQKFCELIYYDGNRLAMPRKAKIAERLRFNWIKYWYC